MRFFIFMMLMVCAAACAPQGTDTTHSLDPVEYTFDSVDGFLVYGGPIYTADVTVPTVEAVLVKDGKIAARGTYARLDADAPPHIRRVDLEGAAMFPGFTDAHAHLIGIGQRELTLNLEGITSIVALVKSIAQAVENTSVGETVYGRGWIETGWPEGRFPNRADLDAVAPDHPVILFRADGHAAVVNTQALQAVNIDGQTPAPSGGAIEKDDGGEPTGILIDNAMGLIMPLIASPTVSQKQEAYRIASQVYAAYGWTGVHNMSVDPADLDMIETLSDQSGVTIRVYNSVDKSGLEALANNGARRSENGRVVTRAVKLYVDGALGSRGAALSQPYSDQPETSGLLLLGADEAKILMQQAYDSGVQINTHAIGDRGNKLVLDWYSDIFTAAPDTDARWRIEHAQILHLEDIPRFADLQVIASMQPSHAIGDLHFAPDRLGEARLDGAYAWQSLIDAGAMIAAGSDAPVERGDPMIEFYAAVARRDMSGFQGGNWRAHEAVSRMDALKMFTLWPAYAAFQEDNLGSITVGKQADFSIFSADIMRIPEADILNVKAVATLVDGQVIYASEAAPKGLNP